MRTSAGATPGLPAIRMSSYLSPRSSTSCAVARSNAATVAVPSDLTSPNFAMPVTSYSRALSVAIRTVSPTSSFCFSAVPWSITTWPAPVAHAPSTSLSGLTCSTPSALESRPTPKYGPSPTGLPSVPMIFAFWSVMSPTATATSGSARTRSRTAASTFGFATAHSLEVVVLKCVRPATTASVPS